MKKSLLFFFSVLLFTMTASVVAEPVNLAEAKKQVAAYHDSGAYRRDITKQIDTGMHYLKQRVVQNKRQKNPDKLAVVLDIDETSLSNYADMKTLNFGGTHAEIDQNEAAGHDPAIKQTLALFNYARANNVAVFFISGRREKYRDVTVKNLENAGYHGWTQLYLAPNDYQQSSITPFKSSTRQQIIDSGYDIVLNIGDQKSDLAGGMEDKALKLPNPYYFIG